MSASRQEPDPIDLIEKALMRMRRDQQARMLQRRAEHHDRHHGDDHTNHHEAHEHDGRHPRGPHDRSLGGAARFRMLDALEQGPRTISDLAQSVGVDQPRASRLVAEAVDHGFVRRGVDPADARRALIELTEAGRARLASAHSSRRDAVATALDGFSAVETAEFARLLSRFVEGWPRA